MSRKARWKSPEFMYHIICRSISEINLFRDDDDKRYYLELLKKYLDQDYCKIYGYCLMDTHVHMHVDTQGYDISKFMHGINTSYAGYYNNKYNRHGSVFADRFKSYPITTDDYNRALSAYIHNNPKAIEEYSGKEYKYPFSSFGIYLGLRENLQCVIYKDYILSLFRFKDNVTTVKHYAEFVLKHRDLTLEESIEKCPEMSTEEGNKDERTVILRNYTPSEVLPYIRKKLGLTKEELLLKRQKAYQHFRAFSAFVLRALGGLGHREICEAIGNIALSESSTLCTKGYDLFSKGTGFSEIFYGIVNRCALE